MMAIDATGSSLADSLEGLAVGVVGMTAMALNEVGRHKDLTLAQWRVLVILGRGSMRVGAIAERLGASLPSASRLVARMEAHGYVMSARDEADRRAMLVTLAPIGRATRDGVIARRKRLLAELVGSGDELATLSLEIGLAVLAERLARFA
jgi:DNA-binding MarR family transcriptional regulator